jgi:hypothetical protein
MHAGTDILGRLLEYNTPDRTTDNQRQIALDIQEAAAEIQRLRNMPGPTSTVEIDKTPFDFLINIGKRRRLLVCCGAVIASVFVVWNTIYLVRDVNLTPLLLFNAGVCLILASLIVTEIIHKVTQIIKVQYLVLNQLIPDKE